MKRWTPYPLFGWRMEASRSPHFGRRDSGNANPRMALHTKRLRRMAAGTTLTLATRKLWMGAEKIPRMNARRPDASVMTVQTVFFGMAAFTQSPVVRTYPTVPDDKIAVVMHAKQPRRWVEPPLGIPTAQPSIRQRQMTSSALGGCAHGRHACMFIFGHGASVTTEALPHRRQVLARALCRLGDSLMATHTAHALFDVACVRKL